MTDEEIEQIVQATGRPGNRWTAPFRKLATWFVTTRIGRWATGMTARWQTIVAVLVMAGIGYPLVAASIGATNDRVTRQEIYVTQLNAYAKATNDYALCLGVAAYFQIDQQRWEILADQFGTRFPSSAGAKQIGDILHNAIDSVAPPPQASECPPPGDPPEPPD